MLDMSRALLPQEQGGSALPSQMAANRLTRGSSGALFDAMLWSTLRGFIIAGGLHVAGEREHLWKKAAYASLAIELYVILWSAAHEEK
jgi:hypothetical protein